MIAVGERAEDFRFLVRGRDTKFIPSFDAVFADVGIAVFRSPPRAPRANAYAERWVSTIRRECLDRMLISHERQLVHLLADYEAHFNSHRPHCALEQRSPTDCSETQQSCSSGAVRREHVLGGLINEYRHAASLSATLRFLSPTGYFTRREPRFKPAPDYPELVKFRLRNCSQSMPGVSQLMPGVRKNGIYREGKKQRAEIRY